MITNLTQKYTFGGLLLLALLLQVSCDEGLPPVVFTNDVTDIERFVALSGGSITSEGGSAVMSRGVCWNTTGDPTVSDSKTQDGNGGGAFESSVTGLLGGTTYFLRGYATNDGGTAYGEQRTFTTKTVPDLPVVALHGIDGIGDSTATPSGAIMNTGGDPETIAGFCWSTSPNPTIADNKVSDTFASPSEFQFTLENLTQATTYYVRAFAENFSGVTYSEQLSFKTLSPIIIVTSLSDRKTPTILVTAIVSDDGGHVISPTDYGIVYGPEPNPKKDKPGTTIRTGNKPNTPNFAIGEYVFFFGGMALNTTFFTVYFRPFVETEAGTVYGPEVSAPYSKNAPGEGVTDIDGNTYASAITAYKEFTTTNLSTTRLNDGTPISLVTDSADWVSLTSPAYTYYDNDPSNKEEFGALYNWYAVETGKLCPAGWHVPAFNEFDLIGILSLHACDDAGRANNCVVYQVGGDTGFEGAPGGWRDERGPFTNSPRSGVWWSTSLYGDPNPPVAIFTVQTPHTLYPDPADKKIAGHSVRCIKD